MTLIQAQERYIYRVNHCHVGHRRRVTLSAWKELSAYARRKGYDPKIICSDAHDMAKLERMADD